MGVMIVHHNDGGFATARLSAGQQDRQAREDRQAAALAYLRRKGLDGPGDVAEILGLIPPTVRPPRRKRKIPAPREDN